MALVALPLAQSDPTMQQLKHKFIDLTQDSDEEPPPAAKRQKSHEIPGTQNHPSRQSTPIRQTTPVGQTRAAIKSKKAVTNPDGNILLTRSPFKNRPSWSKVRSTIPKPLTFPGPSVDQSKQPNGSVPHPRSKSENESAKPSQRPERHPDLKAEITLKQESHPPNPSAPLPVAPDKKGSQDGSRRSENISPSVEDFQRPIPIFKSNPLSQRTSNSTLAERPRSRVTASPTQSRNAQPPADTPSSQISVVIDNSQRAFTQSTATEELLSRFIQPLPATSGRPPERITARNPPVKKEYRRQLLAELEKDTSVIYGRTSSVEAVFGPHGFSQMYSTDGDKALRKQQAQPKAKKIRRKEVKLDWASSEASARELLEPKKLVRPQEQASQILRSRFDDATEPPITFANNLNDKQLSGKFQFISSYIRRPGVEAAPPEARTYGCDCIGGCRPDSCGCLVNDKEIDDFGDEIDRGKIVPYRRVHTATGKTMSVLRDEYMKGSYAEGEKSEIVECNRNCGCESDCWNRVVQKGRTLPLEVFMTAKCGFGLRSPQDIAKGQFIDVYLGEVITVTELESRELATEGAPSYIFSLDWFHVKDVYYVDGLNFGTPTRFMNHSCNPNCRVFTVILNRADEKVYGLAFFATCDIPAGKELNIDYNPQEAGKVYPKPKPGDDDGVVLCQCGSDNCRVRLWPGPKMKKGKGWARS